MDLARQTSLSPTGERLVSLLASFGDDDPLFGESKELLDFMLRSVLVGKEESEIRASITSIWEMLGNVLYPNPDPSEVLIVTGLIHHAGIPLVASVPLP